MASERAQAISVANHYFVLVDGLAPGFKDYLSEHVVLKWFGHVIKGRNNVVAFMQSNKKESLHTFRKIMPVSDISGKDTQTENQKAKRSLDQNTNCVEVSTTDENIEDCNQNSKSNKIDNATFKTKTTDNKYAFDIEKCIAKLRVSIDCDNMNVNFNMNQNEFNANAPDELDDESDFNESELYTLFEPEITSQPIVGKIQNINRIKLKEEMAPTNVRARINRVCGQEDELAAAKATKYLEANGEIKFIRMNMQSADSPFLHHWSNLCKKKVWKRQCKLQIAYILVSNKPRKVNTKCYNTQENTCTIGVSNVSAQRYHNINKIQKSQLPSLEEAIQVSNTLIQDVNHFGGYLQPLNLSEERENFLKSFEVEIAEKNQEKNVHCCAHYVNNKLIFDFPSKKPFSIIYKIRKIVYTNVNDVNDNDTNVNEYKNASNTEEKAGAK